MRDEFNKLWDLLPHPPGSVVRLFARRGDVRTGDYARTPAQMRKFAKANADANCYIAPNPTNSTRGLRHSTKDVTHWSYFLIDMDPVDKKADPQRALERALKNFSGWTGKNLNKNGRLPLIINSGRGLQAWIRLDDVILDDDFGDGRIIGAAEPGGGSTRVISRSTARRVNGHWLRRLAERDHEYFGCKIDTSVSDLPRVMRLPGTVNQKSKKLTSIIEPAPHIYLGLSDILVEGTPEKVLKDPEPIVGVEKGQPWQKVFPYMTRMAQNYLLLGQEEPGRHKCMWHTAKKLAELGVTRTEARRALTRANSLKGEDEKLPPDQVDHALDTAYEVVQM